MVAKLTWDRGTPKKFKLPDRPTHGMNIRPCEKIAKMQGFVGSAFGGVFALVGVSGLIVVRSGGRTLVVPKARAEEVKRLTAQLPDADQ